MNDERDEPREERLSGGELNAAVTREVVRIHTAAIGRGPRKSYSFHNGDTLVTVLLEVLTRAERNLAAYGEGEAVLRMRRLSQRAMTKDLKAAVSGLTGCAVTALMYDTHLNPDMAIQIFVLDSPLT